MQRPLSSRLWAVGSRRRLSVLPATPRQLASPSLQRLPTAPSASSRATLRTFTGTTGQSRLQLERASAAADLSQPSLSADGCYMYIISDNQLQAIETLSGTRRKDCIAHGCSGPLSVSPDGSRVFVAASDHSGLLRAVATTSGKVAWECQVASADDMLGPLEVSPDGGTIFVASSGGTMHAVAVGSGEQRWTYTIAEAIPIEWSFCVSPDGSLVVFWAGDGRLHAVDTKTGERKWVHDQGQAPPVSWTLPASPDGSLVFFATDDDQLHAVSLKSGEQHWALPYDLASPSAFTISPDGMRIVLGMRDGKVHCVAACDGKVHGVAASAGEEQWTYDLGNTTLASSAMSPDGLTVFLGDSNGKLHAVAVGSGERKWLCEKADAQSTSCAVDMNGTTVFLQTSYGTLHAVNAADGEQRWVSRVNDAVDGPILLSIDGACVFLRSRSGQITALSTTSGEQTWRHQLSNVVEDDNEDKGQRQQLTSRLKSLMRSKRVLVVFACLAVFQVHRVGWLRRSDKRKSPEDLESVTGLSPIASVWADITTSKPEDSAPTDIQAPEQKSDAQPSA